MYNVVRCIWWNAHTPEKTRETYGDAVIDYGRVVGYPSIDIRDDVRESFDV